MTHTSRQQANYANQANAPIGIFDSGVGGLSIYQGIKKLLSNEQLIYVGDMAYAPYGEKTTDFIYQRSHRICQFLIAQGVKAIVVACNTATVSVIAQLRADFSLPIIGVEPAVKPAALATKTGHVAVWATKATVASESFANLRRQHSNGIDYHLLACPGLVECIELQTLGPALDKLLDQFVAKTLAHDIDCLVLGCTHYPFVKQQIRQRLPANITLYDTAEPVAKQLQRQLALSQLLSLNCVIAQADKFYTTSPLATVNQVFSALLNKPTVVNYTHI
ncbi:glutamate racemase [Thalassotalea maritima]|uniref:glutamate racemase n=1 Tax=Thalassotalea maritima TaxID=3242416 RepID=UPI0035290E0C